jgi:drug/metabolite transporter (DMT)-like permease
VSNALAVVAATAWACSDYIGGIASRKLRSATLTLYAQSLSVILLVPAALFFGGSPTWSDIGIGAAAGCFNVVGYILMVDGISKSRIGPVIATASVTSVLLPVAGGVLLLGDHLSAFAWLGIAMAVLGTSVVSWETDAETGSRWSRSAFDANVVKFGMGSGAAFGIMFTLLSLVNENAGLWPVLAMRLSIPLVYAYARANNSPTSPEKQAFLYGGLVAVTGTSALCCFSVAVRDGSLPVVSAIATTSPVLTVIIAHYLRAERTTRLQMTGVLVAISGVILLTLY